MSWQARYRYGTVTLFALLAVLAIRLLWSENTPREPQTIDEAVSLARAMGLYAIHDGGEPTTGKNIIVSETPLTWEEAGGVCVSRPINPYWIGKVRIYTGWQAMMPNYDPRCSVVWGELFVYGDPQLVERLTGRRL
jgi:hypothetical protein